MRRRQCATKFFLSSVDVDDRRERAVALANARVASTTDKASLCYTKFMASGILVSKYFI